MGPDNQKENQSSPANRWLTRESFSGRYGDRPTEDLSLYMPVDIRAVRCGYRHETATPRQMAGEHFRPVRRPALRRTCHCICRLGFKRECADIM
jgi:hypothetical protein